MLYEVITIQLVIRSEYLLFSLLWRCCLNDFLFHFHHEHNRIRVQNHFIAEYSWRIDLSESDDLGERIIIYAEPNGKLESRIREDFCMESCRFRAGNLEDVFLRLTGRELREWIEPTLAMYLFDFVMYGSDVITSYSIHYTKLYEYWDGGVS